MDIKQSNSQNIREENESKHKLINRSKQSGPRITKSKP